MIKSIASRSGRTRRRASSRSLRRRRFRDTADCPCRGTTRPSRGWPTLLGRQSISIRGVRLRRPVCSTVLKSRARWSRQVRGSPSPLNPLDVWTADALSSACVPSSSDGLGPDGPTASASGPGNHACYCVCDCAAGTSASSLSSRGARNLVVHYSGGKVDFSTPARYNRLPFRTPTRSRHSIDGSNS